MGWMITFVLEGTPKMHFCQNDLNLLGHMSKAIYTSQNFVYSCIYMYNKNNNNNKTKYLLILNDPPINKLPAYYAVVDSPIIVYVPEYEHYTIHCSTILSFVAVRFPTPSDVHQPLIL